MNYKIAGFVFGVKNKYPYTGALMRGYETNEAAVYTVEIPESEIAASHMTEPSLPPGYHESLCIYRKICDYVSDHNAFMMHSSVLSLNGAGFAFTAKSGTGKTTHSVLWRDNFGAEIINGDKPIYTFSGGEFFAHGTPFCGKENFSANKSVKMKAVCFLYQSKENSIRRMSAPEVISKIFEQVYMPPSVSGKEHVLELLDKFLTAVPFYLLGCDISRGAALLSMRTMAEFTESEEK